MIGACVEKAVGDVRLTLTEPHYGSITRIAIEPMVSGSYGPTTRFTTSNGWQHVQEERNEFSR